MITKNNSTTKDSDLQLVMTCELDAPRELVWKAWTDPKQVKEWLELGGDVTIEAVEMDLCVGGKHLTQIKMADGEFFTVAGTYLEVKPFERLVYLWDWENDNSGKKFGEREGNELQVTVEWQTTGTRTQLRLTHENFSSIESRDRHGYGWYTWLGKLSKFIARKQKENNQ